MQRLACSCCLALLYCAFSQGALAESFDDLVRKGDHFMDARNAKEALNLWQQARLQKPDDPDLKIRIGIAFSLLGEWDKAETEFRETLASNPHNNKALFNLALVFYNKGNYSQAHQHLDQLTILDPNYPELNYHLGLLFEMDGDKQQAHQHYIQEVNINPSCAKAWERLYMNKTGTSKEPSTERCLAIGAVCFLAALILLVYHRQKNIAR